MPNKTAPMLLCLDRYNRPAGLRVYVPFFQEALHTVPLSWGDWGLIFVVAVPVFVTAEAYKWLRWRSAGRKSGALVGM